MKAAARRHRPAGARLAGFGDDRLASLIRFTAMASLLCAAVPAWGQAPSKPNVGVQEFQAVGATAAEATAITDRLREELVRSGKMTVVERSRMNEILASQAEQQASCSGAQCARIGKILGVRFMISGKAVKFAADAWQISATLVDVESARTLKTETVRERGDILSVLDKAVPALAAKLGA